MFNIKNIVNKITDRGRESQPNSPGRSQGDDILSKQAAEGFLCPKCMKAFLSPEELQAHYVSSHDGDTEGAIPDTPTSNNALGFLSLHQEVGERYRQRQDGNSIPDDLGDIEDPLDLKRRLIEALESKAAIQQEKEKLEQRAAQLARDNVSLKAASDEGEGTQMALKERLKVVEAQLSHRESIDDAAVLQQELVQVQRVMDELTREKERERDQLKTELQLLKDMYATREEHHNEQLVTHETQRRIDELENTIRTKDSFISELQVDGERYKSHIADVENKLQEELSRSQYLEEELQLQKNKFSEFSEECQRKADDLECQVKEYTEVKNERDQLINSLEKMQQVLRQQLEEIRVKYDEIVESMKKKDDDLKSAQSFVDALNKQKDILKSELIHKTKNCEDFEKANATMTGKMKEVERTLSQRKDEISRLESERAELLVQIEAGEGANTAIQQLSQEKVMLTNQLKEQGQSHAKYVQEMTSKCENLERERCTIGKENEKFLDQINNHEKKLETLSKNLQENDVLISRLQEELKKKNTALQDLQTSHDSLQKEKDMLTSALTEKTSLLSNYSEKIKNMNEMIDLNKSKLEVLETQNETMGVMIKGHESKLDALQTKLDTTEIKLGESVAEANDLKSEIQKKTAEFNVLSEKLESEIMSLKGAVKDKEEQLKSLGLERTSLETSIFQLTAEMEEEKKKSEDNLKMEAQRFKELLELNNEKISKLEDSRNILLSDKAKLEEEIETLRKEMLNAQKEANKTHETLQAQLKTEIINRETTEKSLEVEKSKSMELQKELQNRKTEHDAEVEKRENELRKVQLSLDEVAGEKLALEAQFAASQSEQQALLERCYACSAESENLRKTMAELRRRLEESQAALHELGRENQTLQLELEKLLGRKWTEDSDAISCTLCLKEFSLIVRKHHCRNCGQIFCNECSSKMAPIASNKKPVRVCDSCYNELGNK